MTFQEPSTYKVGERWSEVLAGVDAQAAEDCLPRNGDAHRVRDYVHRLVGVLVDCLQELTDLNRRVKDLNIVQFDDGLKIVLGAAPYSVRSISASHLEQLRILLGAAQHPARSSSTSCSKQLRNLSGAP